MQNQILYIYMGLEKVVLRISERADCQARVGLELVG